MNTEQKLVEMANEGSLSFEKIALACLAYMSEDDITEMARVEELINNEGEPDPVYEVRGFDDGECHFSGDDLAAAYDYASYNADELTQTMEVVMISGFFSDEETMGTFPPTDS